jgi:hypothetical protein
MSPVAGELNNYSSVAQLPCLRIVHFISVYQSRGEELLKYIQQKSANSSMACFIV